MKTPIALLTLALLSAACSDADLRALSLSGLDPARSPDRPQDTPKPTA